MVQLRNESIEYLIQLAEDEVYNGNYDQSKKLLDSGFYEEPGYPRLHYTLAWMYHYYQVDEKLAERHYELAIYFDANYHDAYEGLQELFMKNKEYSKLNKLLRKAEELNVFETDIVYESLGKIAERKGKLKEAAHLYKKAIFHSVDNETVKDLRQNLRRCRYKRIKSFKLWKN